MHGGSRPSAAGRSRPTARASVASSPRPSPCRSLELEAIRLLVAAGVLVICSGGGGIPVVVDDDGALYGVEAVIDKDLSAALLARLLEADALLMLTDVAAVERGWGTPETAPIRQATPAELRALSFASGSMAPKIEAACRFVEAGGAFAAIGALDDAPAILRGEAGTIVAVESPAWKSVLSARPGSASRG